MRIKRILAIHTCGIGTRLHSNRVKFARRFYCCNCHKLCLREEFTIKEVKSNDRY